MYLKIAISAYRRVSHECRQIVQYGICQQAFEFSVLAGERERLRRIGCF